MAHKKSSKRTADEAFEFPAAPKWMHDGGKQRVISKTYHRIEPTSKVVADPVQVMFNLKDYENCWRMGPNTYFEIKGQFEVWTPAKPAPDPLPEVDWTPVGPEESANVIFQDNWMGASVRKIEVTHGGIPVITSDEGAYISNYLDSFRYSVMDPAVKKKLCMHDCHPGYSVPTKRGDWKIGQDSQWQHYSKHIFLGADKSVLFNWTPIDVFPFFQGKNYLEEEPKVLPMPALKPLEIKILFHDNKNFIYKKTPGNNKLYRFRFEDITLCVEKLWLRDKFQSSFLSHKTMEFPGVTKIARRQEITAGNTTYHTVIQNVALPEGIFIICLPKEVPTGAFEYKNNVDGNVFLPHSITAVKFAYGNQNFFNETFDIGMINKTSIENKLVSDLREFPPFGMLVDDKTVDLEHVTQGGIKTPYPHVYINLLTEKDGSRYIPNLKNQKSALVGSVLKPNEKSKDLKIYNDLDLTLTFDAGKGATANSTYIVYLYYTDVSVSVKLAHMSSTITSPYITNTSN